MKVSLKWLNQYIKIDDLDPNLIAHKLTFAGVEVEGIEKFAQGTNLVIGEVITCDAHPDSHHLHILQIDEGSTFGVKQIVCGAPNVRVGQKVIVAREGAILPNFVIVKSNIRSVASEGMVCSLLELGVDKKHLTEEQINGIEVLPPDAVVGNENVLEYLGLDDTILDLKILPNRSDCLALLNIAKELGAIFERPVKNISIADQVLTENHFQVKSETEKCPQFAVKVVKGIKVGQSPKWLKDILRSMGVRSINNIVDIGNYVMLLLGQPLHMYDLTKLPEEELTLKDNMQGTFTALDNQNYEIVLGDLVVTSKDRPMCLAGIMGSLECAVDDKTTDLAIEAANFDAATVRRTSTRLNLMSDSSQRFIKGINKDQVEFVLDFTAMLIKELCGCREITAINNYDVLSHKAKTIKGSFKRINNRLGTTFSKEQISKVLESIGMEIKQINNDEFTAKVPAHRIDISIEADLSEEVIRLLGLENVIGVLPELKTTVGMLSDSQRKKRNIRYHLLSCGISEVLNYTLVRKANYSDFVFLNHDEPYSLLHPMTDEHEAVRTGLISSLLTTANYNVARQQKDLALFEISDIITKRQSFVSLGVVLTGDNLLRHQMEKRPYSFFDLKGIFEGIMELLSIEPTRYKIERLITASNELHPYRSAVIRIGKDIVGVIGEIHPLASKKYDFGKATTVVMELNLSRFFELRTSEIKSVPPIKFPSVNRDLALLVKADIESGEIIKAIKQVGKVLVKTVEVFDVYVGEHIADGYKSIALTVTYQNSNKTLEENEIVEVEANIITMLHQTFGITLRG